MSHTGEASRRLFFALWPSAAERRALALALAAAAGGSGGRTVPAENLHLTLVFLGSVPQRCLAQLTQIGRACAAMTPGPIEVTFGRIEHWSRPQALVVTTAGEPAAARALAEALKAAAVAAGFTPDLKPFRAHVTVARKVLRAPSLPQLAPLRWCCGSFALIDSRSEAGAPVYSVVESHTLDNGEKADK